jgi:hypothetical protein
VGDAHECGDPTAVPCDLLERRLGRADEARPEQQVLRRVAGDGELREEDEVGALPARLLEPLANAVAVAGQVADDGVDLCEREPQLFPPPSRKPSVQPWRS